MRTIDYYKYASNGNNFVLVDEILEEKVPEKYKAIFSKYIESNVAGIGCDSVIFLQKYDQETLGKIYSGKIHVNAENDHKPEYIIRIYEKYLESNMCGNGLICAGHHLALNHKVKSAKIATEIPTHAPVIRQIFYIGDGVTNAVLGKVSVPPSSFVNKAAINFSKKKQYCHLKDLSLIVNVDNEIHRIFTNNAYLTFTGEPHLVFFKQHNDGVFNKIFDSVHSDHDGSMIDSIIEQIGLQLNKCFDYFPKGVNVNLADILPNSIIANKCFERGINAETYACGTGAVAVAFLANQLKLISSNSVTVLPLRARQHDLYQDASIYISKIDDIYSIAARSILLSKGKYYVPFSLNNEKETVFNFGA